MRLNRKVKINTISWDVWYEKCHSYVYTLDNSFFKNVLTLKCLIQWIFVILRLFLYSIKMLLGENKRIY
jgi:hypothetical protein